MLLKLILEKKHKKETLENDTQLIIHSFNLFKKINVKTRYSLITNHFDKFMNLIILSIRTFTTSVCVLFFYYNNHYSMHMAFFCLLEIKNEKEKENITSVIQHLIERQKCRSGQTEILTLVV
jgi:hypothetical protein